MHFSTNSPSKHALADDFATRSRAADGMRRRIRKALARAINRGDEQRAAAFAATLARHTPSNETGGQL